MSYSFGQQVGFVVGAFIALILVVLGVMYAVTGKIPFYPEPRRNSYGRRNSYRREKMSGGMTPEIADALSKQMESQLQSKAIYDQDIQRPYTNQSIDEVFGGKYSEHKLAGYRFGDHMLNDCKPCLDSLVSIVDGYKTRMERPDFDGQIGNTSPKLLGKQFGFRIKQSCSACASLIEQTWMGMNENWETGRYPTASELLEQVF
jgi:hypothetical protein